MFFVEKWKTPLNQQKNSSTFDIKIQSLTYSIKKFQSIQRKQPLKKVPKDSLSSNYSLFKFLSSAFLVNKFIYPFTKYSVVLKQNNPNILLEVKKLTNV